MFFSSKAAVAAVALASVMSSFAMAGDGQSKAIANGYDTYAGCSGALHTASGEWSGNGAQTSATEQAPQSDATANSFEYVEAASVPVTQANQ
ncbi:MAG: hypothetical protein AAGC96_06270 [Pseudomonadota bacterium]